MSTTDKELAERVLSDHISNAPKDQTFGGWTKFHDDNWWVVCTWPPHRGHGATGSVGAYASCGKSRTGWQYFDRLGDVPAFLEPLPHLVIGEPEFSLDEIEKAMGVIEGKTP